VVALTGTDLYRDLPADPSARRSLELADRIVFLHPLATDELTPRLRKKSVLIRQSVRMPTVAGARRPRRFRVAVLANLRRVKDPLRAAMAARRLPRESRIQVVHVGRVLEKPLAARARKEMRRNPRYQWRGEIPGWKARRLLAGSRLLVLSSRMEGGANVTSEAVVAGVPVLASHIPGNVGLLGRGYRGYFPVGDTESLSELLWRSETDPEFYRSLRRSVSRLAPLFRPALEKKAWQRVLDDLGL
jgi:putative glycosyltransferase (TIGR04348 family)